MSSTDFIPSTSTLVYSYIKGLILNQLLQSDGILKVNELVHLLGKHQLSASTIKSFLVSNSKTFTYLDRYWIPTTRISAKGLSAQRGIKAIIEGVGSPVSVDILAQEISRMNHLNMDTALTTIKRFALHDQELFLTHQNTVGLSKWVFKAQNENLELALKSNQVNPELFNLYKKTLSKVDWNDKNIFNKITAFLSEINLKVLGAVAWESLNSNQYHTHFDWKSFYASLLSLKDWIYCEGFLFPKAKSIEWEKQSLIIADQLKPEIVLESTHLEVKVSDIEKMIKKIVSSSCTVTVKQLLEEFFEIFPSMSNYEKDSHTLIKHLTAEKEVHWLGGNRFQKIKEIPDHIHFVPDLFNFEKNSYQNEFNEDIDFEISDEGLSSSLISIMSHPLAVDVLDVEGYVPPVVNSDTCRFVLKSIYREVGLFPFCQFPSNWISKEPEIQEIIFINPQGEQARVWVNTKAGLLFDLIDWWYDQPIESGAVFTLTKTREPNVFYFKWDNLPDPSVYISNQKMELLRNIDSEGKSTFELLCTLFQNWNKGVDFLTLFWEINVVRRSTRRLLASLLSSYECFYQRSGSSLWFFDSKKLALGINKAKKRFIIK